MSQVPLFWVFLNDSVKKLPRQLRQQRYKSPLHVAPAGSAVLHLITSCPTTVWVHQPWTLRFRLTSNDVSGLQEKLLSIATPGSRDFRQWLSQDEIKTFMAPSSDTLNTFNSFTSTHDLNTSVISPHGDWVAVTLPVWQANTLFGATYANYTHPEFHQ
ncbi:Pro-kumamolisin, activation domain-containing protein [Favolaschia claudopus]|uniref:Pro-kumamolisin, activation domain-containing protein n=1 Tax=Favolaschia claudopus TaxID=2862362 RepID=A0AAW0A356_9AGAR